MMKRLVPLALVAAACVAGPALAASPTWQNYSWDIPLVFGDYIAVPGGDSTTLGSITISRTPDSRGTTGGAIYFYDASGKMVTQAINGTISYTDDAAIARGAPIATTPLTAYTLSGGPVRGGPPGSATATPTSDVIAWEWTGPRAGTLTVNGTTQKMVQAWSGPPLVAEADYSGLWLVVARQVLDSSASGFSTSQQAFSVRLRRVADARSYAVRPMPPRPDLPDLEAWPEGVALPPAGATLYDVTCHSEDCMPDPGYSRGALAWVFGVDPDAAETTLWLMPSGAGHALQVQVSGGERLVREGTCEQARVYAEGDFMHGRQRCKFISQAPHVNEFAMYRIGPDTLDPRWDLPRCESQNFTWGCNPFKIVYREPRDP